MYLDKIMSHEHLLLFCHVILIGVVVCTECIVGYCHIFTALVFPREFYTFYCFQVLINFKYYNL